MVIKNEKLILCGDCGGTNTRLALWYVPETVTGGSSNDSKSSSTSIPEGTEKYSKTFKNEHHTSFVAICKVFLKEADCQCVPDICVLACAGPIINQNVKFTNVNGEGWVIDASVLKQELGIAVVKLINDFAAMGYGLLTLKRTEHIKLNDVNPDANAPIATIGAGTGLGECYLTPHENGVYECYPCEGGHTDYAPSTEIEYELLQHIKKQHGCQYRISTERIVSGPGICAIYEFLTEKYPEKKNETIYNEFKNAGSMNAAVIAQHASIDDLCKQTMEIFVSSYGREVGNAILKYLPRGGFYITGGIAAKNMSLFDDRNGSFLKHVYDKGRVSPSVKNVPISLVLAEDIGGRGAYYYAYQLMHEHAKQEKKRLPYAVAEHPMISGGLLGATLVLGGIIGYLARKK